VIPNLTQSSTLGRALPVASVPARSNIGSNAARQSRFDARARRRYGDWSVLDIPAALLWLEAADDDILDPENPYAY